MFQKYVGNEKIGLRLTKIRVLPSANHLVKISADCLYDLDFKKIYTIELETPVAKNLKH